MRKSLKLTFWALVVVFLLIISEFFIPAIRELFRGSPLFLLPFVVFSLLGIVLLFLTLKQKVEGALKWFLILTGASAGGFFVFVFLHNAFYALNVVTSHIIVLNYLTEILHITFFIIAVLVCPLGFLIGLLGSAVLFIKRKRANSKKA